MEIIFRQFSSEKDIFMLIYLANNPSLGLSIKRVKFKHSNMFVNLILNLTMYNIIFLYVYICLKIHLYV